MSDADQIRELIERRVEALEGRDAAAANACLDVNIVAFEVAGALQAPPVQSRDDALTQAWLDSFLEGPRVTLEQLAIHVDGLVAFCHSLNRLEGTRVDGQRVDVVMRSTLGFSKSTGEWKIVHAHTSVPR